MLIAGFCTALHDLGIIWIVSYLSAVGDIFVACHLPTAGSKAFLITDLGCAGQRFTVDSVT